MNNPVSCPLCLHADTRFFYKDSRRKFWRCDRCALVFVPSEFILSSELERQHYELHENDPADEGYRRFLDRLFTPMVSKLKPGHRGLDFGSGPGPTLSVMFEEVGFSMQIYDLYFAKDTSVLARQYDFLTATEVVEHLAEPGAVLELLWGLLLPGGWLGLMTKLALDREAFSRWHYKNDPTHIVFFTRQTFLWLGEQWGARPEFIGNDVVLFHKPQAV